MTNSLDIFAIALGLEEPWYIKEIVFDKKTITMDIEARKAELIQKNLKPKTEREYNTEIDQAMGDSKNGRMNKATGLKAKIQIWQQKFIG
ncbi:hypothetical protein [Galbibacter sp.]|uniref:hypothetical protein n=1 Tax=Galbibacter sp. TaxID=2918471 RepID=UPI003A93F291